MAFRRRIARKSFGKKRVTKRATRRSGSRKLTALIRKTVKRVSEPKCKRTLLGKVEMYHNTYNSSALNVPMPSQGAGDDQRVGDQIYSRSFRLRLLIGQKADRPNVNFRWWVFNVPKSVPFTPANAFIATTGNVLLDDANTDMVKVIKSGVIRPNQASLLTAGGKEFTFTKTILVPHKKLIKFGPADATVSHNDNDIIFSIAAYDAYGSLVTDNIAYYQGGLDFNYCDP